MLFRSVVLMVGHWTPAAVWIETLPLFIAYRILTVQRTGWKGMLVAALMVPETVYDFFRYGVYVAAVCNVVTRRATRWA